MYYQIFNYYLLYNPVLAHVSRGLRENARFIRDRNAISQHQYTYWSRLGRCVASHEHKETYIIIVFNLNVSVGTAERPAIFPGLRARHAGPGVR